MKRSPEKLSPEERKPDGIQCLGCGGRCNFPRCDCGCGAPPPRIFGEVPAHG